VPADKCGLLVQAKTTNPVKFGHIHLDKRAPVGPSLQLSATCSAAGNICEILCDRLVLLKVLVLLKITQKRLGDAPRQPLLFDSETADFHRALRAFPSGSRFCFEPQYCTSPTTGKVGIYFSGFIGSVAFSLSASALASALVGNS
jgi:hypothetical protein